MRYIGLYSRSAKVYQHAAACQTGLHTVEPGSGWVNYPVNKKHIMATGFTNQHTGSHSHGYCCLVSAHVHRILNGYFNRFVVTIIHTEVSSHRVETVTTSMNITVCFRSSRVVVTTITLITSLVLKRSEQLLDYKTVNSTNAS
jgi:hypothetical protein